MVGAPPDGLVVDPEQGGQRTATALAPAVGGPFPPGGSVQCSAAGDPCGVVASARAGLAGRAAGSSVARLRASRRTDPQQRRRNKRGHCRVRAGGAGRVGRGEARGAQPCDAARSGDRRSAACRAARPGGMERPLHAHETAAHGSRADTGGRGADRFGRGKLRLGGSVRQRYRRIPSACASAG